MDPLDFTEQRILFNDKQEFIDKINTTQQKLEDYSIALNALAAQVEQHEVGAAEQVGLAEQQVILAAQQVTLAAQEVTNAQAEVLNAQYWAEQAGAAASSSNVAISAGDTMPAFLNEKINVTGPLNTQTINPGADEQLNISLDVATLQYLTRA